MYDPMMISRVRLYCLRLMSKSYQSLSEFDLFTYLTLFCLQTILIIKATRFPRTSSWVGNPHTHWILSTRCCHYKRGDQVTRNLECLLYVAFAYLESSSFIKISFATAGTYHSIRLNALKGCSFYRKMLAGRQTEYVNTLHQIANAHEWALFCPKLLALAGILARMVPPTTSQASVKQVNIQQWHSRYD